ncbi:MAG TPA: hypothetical protein VN154_05460 [Rhizomicrobium sp.]|nr:hypothetical protein [Rhizomicrobium sp.]
MNRALVQFALIVAVAVGLAACPPVTSKTPIGSTVKAEADPALTGMWKGRIGNTKIFSYFTFLPQKDGTITALLITPPSAQDEGGWGAFNLQTVALGSNHFINARETFEDNKTASGAMADNVIPLLYRINGDGAVVVYIVDENAAKTAIRNGKITGTIQEGEFGDIVLTAAPGDLDAYMASPAGRALFVKPLTILRKVK